jgi:hypothetical protein
MAMDGYAKIIGETKLDLGPKVPEGLVIYRYEHGGGRVYWERNGGRDLVMDLYDDDPEGKRRDAIIDAVLRAGILE